MEKSLEELGQSIGSFAMNLIEENEVQAPISMDNMESIPDSSIPDISKIELPDTLNESLLGITVPKKPIVTQIQKKTSTEDLNILLQEFKDVLSEMKETLEALNEMTTVGAIGVNLGKSKITKQNNTKVKSRDKFATALHRLKSKRSR